MESNACISITFIIWLTFMIKKRYIFLIVFSIIFLVLITIRLCFEYGGRVYQWDSMELDSLHSVVLDPKSSEEYRISSVPLKKSFWIVFTRQQIEIDKISSTRWLGQYNGDNLFYVDFPDVHKCIISHASHTIPFPQGGDSSKRYKLRFWLPIAIRHCELENRYIQVISPESNSFVTLYAIIKDGFAAFEPFQFVPFGTIHSAQPEFWCSALHSMRSDYIKVRRIMRTTCLGFSEERCALNDQTVYLWTEMKSNYASFISKWSSTWIRFSKPPNSISVVGLSPLISETYLSAFVRIRPHQVCPSLYTSSLGIWNLVSQWTELDEERAQGAGKTVFWPRMDIPVGYDAFTAAMFPLVEDSDGSSITLNSSLLLSMQSKLIDDEVLRAVKGHKIIDWDDLDSASVISNTFKPISSSLSYTTRNLIIQNAPTINIPLLFSPRSFDDNSDFNTKLQNQKIQSENKNSIWVNIQHSNRRAQVVSWHISPSRGSFERAPAITVEPHPEEPSVCIFTIDALKKIRIESPLNSSYNPGDHSTPALLLNDANSVVLAVRLCELLGANIIATDAPSASLCASDVVMSDPILSILHPKNEPISRPIWSPSVDTISSQDFGLSWMESMGFFYEGILNGLEITEEKDIVKDEIRNKFCNRFNSLKKMSGPQFIDYTKQSAKHFDIEAFQSHMMRDLILTKCVKLTSVNPRGVLASHESLYLVPNSLIWADRNKLPPNPMPNINDGDGVEALRKHNIFMSSFEGSSQESNKRSKRNKKRRRQKEKENNKSSSDKLEKLPFDYAGSSIQSTNVNDVDFISEIPLDGYKNINSNDNGIHFGENESNIPFHENKMFWDMETNRETIDQNKFQSEALYYHSHSNYGNIENRYLTDDDASDPVEEPTTDSHMDDLKSNTPLIMMSWNITDQPEDTPKIIDCMAELTFIKWGRSANANSKKSKNSEDDNQAASVTQERINDKRIGGVKIMKSGQLDHDATMRCWGAHGPNGGLNDGLSFYTSLLHPSASWDMLLKELARKRSKGKALRSRWRSIGNLRMVKILNKDKELSEGIKKAFPSTVQIEGLIDILTSFDIENYCPN